MEPNLKIPEVLNADSNVTQRDLRYSQLKQATIMMVDDEPIMLEIVQALLEDVGYQNFITIQDSNQAVQKLLDSNPDLLLLDLDMPDVNGFDILKTVRTFARYQFMPIIILTAAEDPKSKLKALELGATDFLSKPVDPSELVLRVRNTLSAKAFQDQLAYYDSLTGLPNRKLFIDRLGWEILLATRENKSLVLLDIGLDRFRQINETIGLTSGDQILKIAAERIHAVIRSSDFLGRGKSNENMARIGGDEFSIVLYGVNCVENASIIGNRVLQSIKQPFVLDDNDMYLSASIGISVFPQDGDDVESIIKHAAAAKDFAKKQGMDNFQFYSSDINSRAKEIMKMESDLRKALENDEFELYYQPQVNASNGKVMGMECLLRWIHPEDGFIPPDVFITVAENMGLIVPLGEWVLRQACFSASEWVLQGHEALKVSVNVSPQQFNEDGLVDSIKLAINDSGLNPHNLVLEITESMLMGNIDHFAKLLHEINDLGVSISLDDFGTGYSSLSYLKKFPINELKIDKSFLTDVPAIKQDNLIVKAIIAMSHGLGQKVVAEGVENEAQLAFLKALNCDIIQGSYFSTPLNKVDFSNYLSLNASL